MALHLRFEGPYHISKILDKGEFSPTITAKGEYGIYSFGFVYGKENHRLTIPKDYSTPDQSNPAYTGTNEQFIPYYVGLDSNIDKFTRLLEHYQLGGSTSKVIRFSKSFMKEFFKSHHALPINYSNAYNKAIINYFKKYNKTLGIPITYFNDKKALHAIYDPNKPKIKYPGISQQLDLFPKNDPCYFIMNGTSHIEDMLGQLIGTLNNYWFMYAAIDVKEMELLNKLHENFKGEKNTPIGKQSSNNLSILESITFWALKGLTVSKIKKYYHYDRRCINLNWDNNLDTVFKTTYKENGWMINNFDHCDHKDPRSPADDVFPGY
jgi:hypothetical protein